MKTSSAVFTKTTLTMCRYFLFQVKFVNNKNYFEAYCLLYFLF